WSLADPSIHTCNDFSALDCTWAPLTWSNYGTVWRGFLRITQAGTYELGAVAKDGFAISIDGREIVRSNLAGAPISTPAQRTVRTSLVAGMHPLTVTFSSAAGAVSGNGIDFIWRPPGQSALSLVPSSS